MKLGKMTEIEKQFAEKNHNLIYGFLHKRGYSIEEYYQIAVFGFIKAVEVYHRKPDVAEKYDFPYIACQYMRAEVKDYVKTENNRKHKPEESVVSLDAKADDLESLYNIIGEKSVETDMIERQAVLGLLEPMTELQQKISVYKMNGFNNREICIMLKVPESSFYAEMKRIKSMLTSL